MKLNNGIENGENGSFGRTESEMGNYIYTSAVSEELLLPSPRRAYDVGRGVNDLRNGRSTRSVTPTTSIASSSRSISSVRTRLISEHGSSISTSPSEMRRLRDPVPRQKFDTNEPHPYGLESRNLSEKITTQSSSVHVQNVKYQETRTSGSRGNSTSNANVFAQQVTSGKQFQGPMTRSRTEGYMSNTVHNANNNNRSTIYEEETMFPYSSDSDTSVNSSFRSTSSLSAVERYFKKPVVSVCTYIYLFLVGLVYVEKWCLYVKREDRVDVNGGEYLSELDRQSSDNSEHTTASSLYQGIRQSSDSVSSSFGSYTSSIFEHGTSYAHRLKMMFTEFYQNVAECFCQSATEQWTVFKRFLKILARFVLVSLILLLIWTYGQFFWRSIKSGSGNVVEYLQGVCSSFLTSWIVLGGSQRFREELPTPKPNVMLSNPSSEKTEKMYLEVVMARQESTAAFAALKSTQETIDALKVQIHDLELTLADHESRLNVHDNTFKTLDTDIQKIILAMNAASAKDKTIEQIIEEVLSATVGETSDGTPVSLESLFGVLNEKIERNRISDEINVQLQILSDDIGRVRENVASFNGDYGILKSDLNAMNSRVEELKTSVEQEKVEPELDFEKLKGIILPVLTNEIQKSVAVSCETRNCPEVQQSLGQFSAADIELMIKRAISKYDADKTGLPDLALESAGGSILSTRCTKSSELRNSVISYWGFRLWSPPNTPRTIIQPGVVPGECWAFEGSVGDVVIKLAVPSLVTGFTVEHISKTVSRYGHIDSAPKHFQVLGLMSEHDTVEVHDYGSFIYEDNGEPLQHFPVHNVTTKPYPIVELKVLSNHGNMRHTCIYRFRVHGAIDLGRSHGGSKSTEDSSSKK